MSNELPIHQQKKSSLSDANRRLEKQTTTIAASLGPHELEESVLLLSRSVDSSCRTEKYNFKGEDNFYKSIINSAANDVDDDGRKLYGPIFESGLKELHYLSFNNKIVRSNSDDSLNNNNQEDSVHSNSSCKMDSAASNSRSKDISGKKCDQIQYEIVQQGPDLQQDSPRSARSSPKSNNNGIATLTTTSTSTPPSMSNSPATQHKNLLPTSDSPPAQNPVFLHQYHQQQFSFSQPSQKFIVQQQQKQATPNNSGSPQHLTNSNNPPTSMIFSSTSNPPPPAGAGYYYNPAAAYSQPPTAYSQPPTAAVRPPTLLAYDPNQVAPSPANGPPPTIFYQPLMGATVVPSGGFYYAAPANVMNAVPPTYMVSTQSVPWTALPSTDYANLGFAANPTQMVYSSHMHHPSAAQQPQYVQQQPSVPFLPANQSYTEFRHQTQGPSFTREDDDGVFEQSRERSIEREEAPLPNKFLMEEEETLVVFRKPQAPSGGKTVEAYSVSSCSSSTVVAGTSGEPQRRHSSGRSDYHVVEEESKSISPNLKEQQNVNYSNESTCPTSNSSVSDSPRHSTNRYHTGAKLELEHGRTPLFGQCPTWWGEKDVRNDEDESMCLSLNIQSEYQQRRASPQTQRKIESASDTEGWAKKVEPSTNQQPPKYFHRENIRMDIPFSSIETVEPDPSEKRRSGGSSGGGSGALSFTIEFTPNEDGKKRKSLTAKPTSSESKAEDQWKAQSAERVHRNFVRRSLRKAGGITAESHPLTAAAAKNVQNKEQELRQTAKDPKTYLLSKMLDGEIEEPVKMSKEDNSAQSSPTKDTGIRPRRESDAGSDAGTYVVERDQEQDEEIKARLQIDRVFGVGSRSSSSSCERSPSPVSYEEAVIQKPRPKPPVPAASSGPHVYAISKKISPSVVSNKSTPKGVVGQKIIDSSEDKEEEKRKKGLLKQLLKISQQQHTPGSVPDQQPPPARKSILKKTNSSVGNNLNATNINAPSSSSSSNFSRAEQGRLSLRTGGTTPATRLSSGQPSKAKAPPPKPSAKDNEMSLWLRRKEYNPMKAAAEGRSKKTSTSSSVADPPYLSNRSQSFHSGAIMPKGGLKKHQSIEDSLANDFGDLDPLSDSAAVAKYSRTFATSLNRLSSKPTAESDNDTTTRRSKALDVNSLTNLARLSKELGFHAKDVLTKLQISSNSGSNSPAASRSMTVEDDVFGGCRGDDASEEDSLEHSGSAGITSLVKQLELANQAFAVVDKYLKNQPATDEGNSEPADPTLPSDRQHFNIRRTRLTKLDSKFAPDSRTGRRYSEKD